MQKQLINLDESMLIGKGRDRACYAHPYDLSLCIKIAIKAEKQSRREKRYLSYLKRKNRDISLLSDFKGVVKTDKGTGYLFELVRNNDGSIAESLTNVIKKQLISVADIKTINDLLEDYLTKQQICAYDLSPNNLVVFTDQNGKLACKIIDGIGVAKPNPLLTRLPSLITKSQQKALARFKRKTQLLLDDLK